MDHVLLPDTSSTWTAALFALRFELIALCRTVAAAAGGRGEMEREDGQSTRDPAAGEKGSHNGCHYLCIQETITQQTKQR